MTYVVLSVAVAVFILLIRLTRIVPVTRVMMADTRDALAVMGAPDLSEDEKERAIQSAAIRAFRALFSIVARVAVIVFLPLLLVIVGANVGLYTLEEASAAAVNGYFIAASTLVVIVLWRFLK